MPETTYPSDIDVPAIPFLDQLNQIDGVETRSCCTGHDGEKDAHIGLCLDWKFDKVFELFTSLDRKWNGGCKVQLQGMEVGRPRWVIWLDWFEGQIEDVIQSARCVICEHEWVDARNKVVISGEVCPKCGALR